MCSVNGAIHQEPRRLLALQLEAGRRPLSSFDGLSPASSTWVSRVSRVEPGGGRGISDIQKGRRGPGVSDLGFSRKPGPCLPPDLSVRWVGSL